MFDLTQIVIAVIGLLFTVITGTLLPKLWKWITEKLGAAHAENAKRVTLMLVEAAEQLYGSAEGKKKIAYVQSELLKRNMTIDIAQIESAVYEAFNTDKE